MLRVDELTEEQVRALHDEHHMVSPIEQTPAWARYQASIEGREPWGWLGIYEDEQFLAYALVIAYHTHGYTYLNVAHGPCWVNKPDEQRETQAFAALRTFVHSRDKSVVFVRLAAWNATLTSPVLSTIAYDSTVVVDLHGGDEEILRRMPSRGRANVRKALRESPAECADETQRALRGFDEYYGVMVDTAQRDGFTPAPASTYASMLRELGPEHARLYVGRINGVVSNWCLMTLNDNQAVYYYGCMSTAVRKLRAPDKLFYYAFCDLGRQGYDTLDMMGIGSPFCPQLNTLNQFKTKFAPKITTIAPARDLPVRSHFYAALVQAKALRAKLRTVLRTLKRQAK